MAALSPPSYSEMSSLRPVVLSGPSGAGKSSLLTMLMENFPCSFAFSVSHTTRKPRPGEVHGKDYNFVSVENMMKDINDGKFLEYAQFAGDYYGTPRDGVIALTTRPSSLITLSRYFAKLICPLLRPLCGQLRTNFYSLIPKWNTRCLNVLEGGRICILDVDANGVRSIHAARPPLNARFVFIGPPSIQELERRLRNRGTENDEKIQSRLRQAVIDIDFANSPQGKSIYNLHIINDNLDEAYEKLFSLLKDDIAVTLDSRDKQIASF